MTCKPVVSTEIYLKGHSDRVYAFTSCDTLWDPSRAPAGKHLVGVEEFAAPRRLFRSGEWADIKETFKTKTKLIATNKKALTAGYDLALPKRQGDASASSPSS